MPPAVFEPIVSASERPQTYALDRAAVGTSNGKFSYIILCYIGKQHCTWKKKLLFLLAACAKTVVICREYDVTFGISYNQM